VKPACGDVAGETMLSVKEVFHRPGRATGGWVCPLLVWLHAALDVPDRAPLPRPYGMMRQHGRAHRKRQSGNHRRSWAETTIFRLKTLFGDRLGYRRLDTQGGQIIALPRK
jgi:hypothetical protein